MKGCSTFRDRMWNVIFVDGSYLTIGLLTLAFSLICRQLMTTKKKDRLPPSPGIAIPVLGHFYLLDEDLRITFKRMRKTCGDIFFIQFGSIPTVVISSYSNIKDGFMSSNMFLARPRLFMLDKITNGGKGILMAQGEDWKVHRKFSLSTLKQLGMGKNKTVQSIHLEAKAFVEELKDTKGEPFDPSAMISSHIANIICAMTFSERFNYSDPRFQKLLKMFEELNVRSTASLANFFPWIAKLPGKFTGVEKMKGHVKELFSYIDDIVEEHKTRFDENNLQDLTSAYMHELRQLEKNAITTSVMNFTYLTSVITDFFVGGIKTTSSALSWCIVCLVEHPDIQENICDQIHACVGRERMPSMEDKTDLPLVEAFCMEVLRVCNVPAILLHSTSCDVEFKGYTIPAGCMVLPDLVSVHKDPEIWGDPESFRPGRFLDEQGKVINKKEFLPFFVGKRSCIGESLARSELFLFVSCLLQNFIFENPKDEAVTVKSVDGQFGIVHEPKPYRIVAKMRK
ncbi:cytochrome P450 2C15-like isoform X1 [Mya arenaria]|uniref:cytochrome P450 2C15-like isoform X1 n=1 Tax=Mya arenaria TaxID=6604 RepID=UPI0022DFFE54|nr:cytochrome P450 2C15-like isoform X1 [Mya arenaria]